MMQLQNEGQSSSSFAALESLPNEGVEEVAASKTIVEGLVAEGLVEESIEDEFVPIIVPIEEPNEEDEDEAARKKARFEE